VHWTVTRRFGALIFLVTTTVPVISAAQAAGTPEGQCQAGRYKAAAQYAACYHKLIGKLFGGTSVITEDILSRCRGKYWASWARLQKKANGTGSTCNGTRFVDTGDGTVTDRLTGLQWEKKTDDGTLHDKDDSFTWSGGGGFDKEDGTVFTSFLAQLNTSPCFAGHCGWRLPTVEELQTILLERWPCSTTPCVDGTFGSTAADRYWSSTTYATDPTFAWYVSFASGSVGAGNKGFSDFVRARAVRGGL
jgi:hypothetical protein